MIDSNVFEYKYTIHWIQLAIHAIPFLISIPIVIKHYRWGKTIQGKLTKTEETVKLLEENTKLTFTTLQIIVFISIYLALDIFFSLYQIEVKTSETAQGMKVITDRFNEKNQIFNSLDDAYVVVKDVLEDRKNKGNPPITLDILAYTTYSIGPKLPIWKDNAYLQNLTINVFYIDKDFAKHSSNSIDPGWVASISDNVKEIASFRERNKKFLAANQAKINLIPYKHIPGIHGFRIRNEKWIISFSRWNLAQGYISMPNNDTWIVIDKHNDSPQADIFKNLFDNWVTNNSLREKPQ